MKTATRWLTKQQAAQVRALLEALLHKGARTVPVVRSPTGRAETVSATFKGTRTERAKKRGSILR